MKSIKLSLTQNEKIALASAVEAAIAAEQRALLGETNSYYDEDAAVRVTEDRVDAVRAHTAALTLEAMRAMYRALQARYSKTAPAPMFGIVAHPGADKGVELSVEEAYAPFVSNMLALAFQHGVVLAPDPESMAAEFSDAEQKSIVVERERAHRNQQRKLLKRLIQSLS